MGFFGFYTTLDQVQLKVYKIWDVQIWTELFYKAGTFINTPETFWETLPLWGAHFKPDHVPELLIMNLISCGMLLLLLLFIPSYISRFFRDVLLIFHIKYLNYHLANEIFYLCCNMKNIWIYIWQSLRDVFSHRIPIFIYLIIHNPPAAVYGVLLSF